MQCTTRNVISRKQQMDYYLCTNLHDTLHNDTALYQNLSIHVGSMVTMIKRKTKCNRRCLFDDLQHLCVTIPSHIICIMKYICKFIQNWRKRRTYKRWHSTNVVGSSSFSIIIHVDLHEHNILESVAHFLENRRNHLARATPTEWITKDTQKIAIEERRENNVMRFFKSRCIIVWSLRHYQAKQKKMTQQ